MSNSNPGFGGQEPRRIRDSGRGLPGRGNTLEPCHSEERSDEESLLFLAFCAERFLASLGMTASMAFFRKLSRWMLRLLDESESIRDAFVGIRDGHMVGVAG